MAIGAAQTIIRHRQPAGRRQQYQHRTRRASASGRLQVGTTNAINAILYDNLNFNFIRDIAPVASMMRTTNVMVVQPSFPAKSVPEFIAYAKENPGKINMADAGVGSPPHVYGELFKAMAGVDLIQVHYRGGGPALVDLLGGQVQVMFESITSSIEYIRAGKLRALAITSATRSVALPDIPTMSEFVPRTLNREINAGLADPTMKARIADLGGSPMRMTPTDFGKFIADETEKWGKVIRAANIKPE
jgi:tripartite-type tricarboxylate transporter receptor subunit TctC